MPEMASCATAREPSAANATSSSPTSQAISLVATAATAASRQICPANDGVAVGLLRDRGDRGGQVIGAVGVRGHLPVIGGHPQAGIG